MSSFLFVISPFQGLSVFSDFPGFVLFTYNKLYMNLKCITLIYVCLCGTTTAIKIVNTLSFLIVYLYLCSVFFFSTFPALSTHIPPPIPTIIHLFSVTLLYFLELSMKYVYSYLYIYKSHSMYCFVQLLSLSLIIFRFICIVGCNNSSFLFINE